MNKKYAAELQEAVQNEQLDYYDNERQDMPLTDALIEVYVKSTYETGQHELLNCRICHAEQSYHTGILTHKDGCAVAKVHAALVAQRQDPNPAP